MTVSPPKFSDFFKASFYQNTYLPPVDLSDAALSRYMLSNEDKETAGKIQKLVSEPEVKKVFTEPLTYQPKEFQEKGNILSKKGFSLLSKKPVGTTIVPYYSVVEHGDVPGKVLKLAARRVPEETFMPGVANDQGEMGTFAPDESLMRLEMAERIRTVAKESGIEVVVPKKRLVAFANNELETNHTKKYVVVCDKVDVLSPEETKEAIKGMDSKGQREIAKKISTLIQKVGLADTTFHNIRLTKDRKIAIIDTEPSSLLVSKQSGSNTYSSVEKCARMGLFVLRSQALKTNIFGDSFEDPALISFHDVINEDYNKLIKPALSKWKIVLSIVTLGIYPLINCIHAVVKARFAQMKMNEIDAVTKEIMNKSTSIGMQFSRDRGMNSVNEEAIIKLQEKIMQDKDIIALQKKQASLQVAYYAAIEGVPYKPIVNSLALFGL